MKYEFKWVEKNLGITRKTIYEHMEHQYIEDQRNQGKHLELSEDEIKIIWFVKTLVGMGFCHKDIKDFLKAIKEERECSISKTIKKKIPKIEKEIKEKFQALALAKTIELTGRIPVINDIGTMKYTEFMKYIKDNFTFALKPEIQEIEELLTQFQNIKEGKELNIEATTSYIIDSLSDTTYIYFTNKIDILLELITKFEKEEYTSDIIQNIIKLLYEHIKTNGGTVGWNTDIDKSKFNNYFGNLFWDGITYPIYCDKYGEQNVIKIRKAIEYFSQN